jgi:hypothetical protein
MVPGDSTKVLQRCGEYTYEQGELRGIVRRGELRKQTDVPLPYNHPWRQLAFRSTVFYAI